MCDYMPMSVCVSRAPLLVLLPSHDEKSVTCWDTARMDGSRVFDFTAGSPFTASRGMCTAVFGWEHYLHMNTIIVLDAMLLIYCSGFPLHCRSSPPPGVAGGTGAVHRKGERLHPQL